MFTGWPSVELVVSSNIKPNCPFLNIFTQLDQHCCLLLFDDGWSNIHFTLVCPQQCMHARPTKVCNYYQL